MKENGKASRGHKTNNTTNKEKVKSIDDYIFQIGTARQASDFPKTSKFIIGHIRETYKNGADVGAALEQREDFNFKTVVPALDPNWENLTGVDKIVAERMYDARLKAYISREECYRTNMENAYALLFKHCNKALQNKLESRTDWKSKIYGNAIELLKAIEEHSISFEDTKYEMVTIANALKNFINLRQKEDESLIDYVARFKSAKDILVAQIGGPIELKKYKANATSMTTTDDAFEMLIAYLLLENADKSKYGSIITNLQSQYTLGNNQYPEDLIHANQVLSNHRFDSSWNQRKNRQQGANQSQQHHKQGPELSFAQKVEIKCWCCGMKNHKVDACRRKEKIPHDQWAINKWNKNKGTEEKSEKEEKKEEKTVNWNHTQMQFKQTQVQRSMKNKILLDSQSSVDLFCNKALVDKVTPAKDVLTLMTNAGRFNAAEKAQCRDYGDVWFSEKAVTNIFSLGNMEDKYRVTYDSSKESAFLVHMPDKIVRFTRGKDNLYSLDPFDDTSSTDVTKHNMLETVEEIKEHFSARQIQRAKNARRFIHALGMPTLEDAKRILKMNTIQDCKITTEDINLCKKVFGEDMSSLKGKTTRQKPNPVVQNTVEIPPELMNDQRNIELCVDTMYWNELPFFVTVAKNLQYRTAEFMTSLKAEEYQTKLTNVVRLYKSGGFNVTMINADPEFKPLREYLMDAHGIKVNFASAKEHVPEIERSIRTIKERVRSIFYSLPFKAITKLMIKYLVCTAVEKLNYVPAKHGISQYYSPREIVLKQKLRYDQCQIPIFQFVQAHDEPHPSNSSAPRTLDCIYLKPTYNAQGGHELLHLATGRIITRRKVTMLPMPTSVIQLVNELAAKEGIKGLKLALKNGTILYDSDVSMVDIVAGVDEDKSDDAEDVQGDVHTTGVSDTDTMDVDQMHEVWDKNDDYTTMPTISDENTPMLESEDSDNESNTPILESEDSDNESSGTEIGESDSGTEPGLAPTRSENETPNNEPTTELRRGTRERRPPTRLNLLQAGDEQRSYKTEEAGALATIISQMNERMAVTNFVQGDQHVVTYSLKKGIEKFGRKGEEAIAKEINQQIERKCFVPVKVEDITRQERNNAIGSLAFLVEKHDGTVKARHCANGAEQRAQIRKEDASSPAVSTEAVLITSVIDAEEGRDVVTCDIPNAFIQADVNPMEDGSKIIMKIRGALVDLLCKRDASYKEFVTIEAKGNKVLYVHVMKAIYGMLMSALLFYQKWKKDLIAQGFVINPYDPCVANKMVNGKQLTVIWHVDDVKASHMDPKVNKQFIEWVKKRYGKIGEVKVTNGKRHRYVGMTLDFSVAGQVSIDMRDYVGNMIQNFPETLPDKKITSPWTKDLFEIDEDSPSLTKELAEIFHTITAQGLFLCKRGRPDIAPAIAFLTTRVQKPNHGDWSKLRRLIRYLQQTAQDVLTLKADRSKVLKWKVDAAFALHNDYRSHTGLTFTMGKGAITSSSKKQNVNTRSSTEAELVASDDAMSPMIWTLRFLEEQGYAPKDNILYQDNQSTIRMQMNGRKSVGNRSRHLNIRLFYVTDCQEKGDINIVFCPTDQMTADYFTKPLLGAKFKKFRQEIMNLPASAQHLMWCCMQI